MQDYDSSKPASYSGEFSDITKFPGSMMMSNYSSDPINDEII